MHRRAWVLGAAAGALTAALAAAPAAAQGGGEQRTPDYPAPRPLLFPRERAGWLPVEATLSNKGDQRAALRFRLVDQHFPDKTRTLFDAEIEAGGARRAIGYVWGSTQRWGASSPQGTVRLIGPGGRFSPPVRIPVRPAEGWQVAALLDLGPGGGGLPARIPAMAPRDGVRPGLAADVSRPAGQLTKQQLAALLATARTTSFHVRVLSPGAMPAHMVGWDAADLLIVSSRAPLDELSLAERTAVLQWVALGGVVLVDAAAPVQTLTRPLVAELCGGRPGVARPMAAAPAAPPPDTGPDPNAVARTMAGRTATVVPPPAGFAPLESWGGVPVLGVRRHGHGLIYYSAVDCTRPEGGRAADLAPLLMRVMQDARQRQQGRPEPLGYRWPGQPAGEARHIETSIPQIQQRLTAKRSWWYGSQRGQDPSAMLDLAESLHTGRARMPSTLGVMVFLGLYLLALGPGVWWLRRRWGGGLVGIPITLGAALLFGLVALGFGLTSRGIGLVTQRVTYLWPVPELPLAAECTGFSLYAGLGRSLDVHFPGQVAPLPVGRAGRVGDDFRLDVRFGTEGTDAVGMQVGAWQTRVLVAEGVRAIGGPVAVTTPNAEEGTAVTITNASAMPLGRGMLWRVGTLDFVPVPPVAAGATVPATVPVSGAQKQTPIEYLGLPMPERYDRQGLLGPVAGPNSSGGPVMAGRLVYLAVVDPADVPGGGPVAPGEDRETDRVFCVVPLQVVAR